jgi:hypothetical protein
MISINSIEFVRRAKARYCRFVDTKDWESFGTLFVDEPTIRMYDPSGGLIASFDRREDYISAAKAFVEGGQTIHQLHNDEIDHLSETDIGATWSMEDLLVFPKPRADQPLRLNGFGHFHERWTLGDGGWRIARLELRRTILEITHR